ncbi:SubName: Full=Uncharacterized protein {ECO:0000313/EMBL:CCA72046.1} [Serendipita indica DSM 11827]|nr:SubName: Full=Uncharacterized protein {ECO:0000313/EMBL:CCA72046.1} [Serendipita indica DSM 11827]
MTLMAKDGASTSGDDDLKSPLSFQPAPQSDISAPPPPSYAETLTSPASTSQAHEVPANLGPLPPPSNYNGQNATGPIKGTWVIDSSMEIPAAFLQPSGFLNKKKDMDNLNLSTSYGSVKSSVLLVSGERKRVSVNLFSQFGNVEFRLLSRVNDQPLKLTAKTQNGNVVVVLPRTFSGPLRFKTGWGKVTFSSTMTAHQFSESTAYLGDWTRAGFQDYKTWEGDEVDVSTQYGDIRFLWVDEDTGESSDAGIGSMITGFFGGLKGMFGGK